MREYQVAFPAITAASAPRVKVKVPGSKAITLRALLVSALSRGKTLIKGAMSEGDADTLVQALRSLGFRIEEKEGGWLVEGANGEIPVKRAFVDAKSSGVTARFLAAALAFSGGEYEISGSSQLKNRPMEDLFFTLSSMGAEIEYLEKEGQLPVRLRGIFRKKGLSDVPKAIEVDITKSSQFASALMIAAKDMGIAIRGVGEHGTSYIELTQEVIRRFKEDTPEAGQERVYEVEPDWATACYFFALAGVLGICVEVEGLRKESLQPDVRFLKVLETMGCKVEERAGGVWVTGPAGGSLRGGFLVDMKEMPDQILTLAAIAPYAHEPISMTGIDSLPYKESDRIRGALINLEAMGIEAKLEGGRLSVWPGRIRPARIQTFEDHRLAMAFSLAGLKSQGIMIENPDCCQKSFGGYFCELTRVAGELESQNTQS